MTRWTNSNDAVIFSTNLYTRPGVTQRTQGEMISIAEQNIAGMEAPAFSGGRTAAIVVLGSGCHGASGGCRREHGQLWGR